MPSVFWCSGEIENVKGTFKGTFLTLDVGVGIKDKEGTQREAKLWPVLLSTVFLWYARFDRCMHDLCRISGCDSMIAEPYGIHTVAMSSSLQENEKPRTVFAVFHFHDYDKECVL